MKNYLCFAVMCVVITACIKDSVADNGMSVFSDTEELIFRGSMETVLSLKSTPVPDGSVVWNSSDEIGVYDGVSYVKATVISRDGNQIEFKADVKPDVDYIAVCPYDAIENGIADFVEGKIVLAAARAEQEVGKQVVSVASIKAGATDDVAFYNVGTLLAFSVGRQGVKKAVIKGNDGEIMSGSIEFDPDNGTGISLLGGDTEVSVDVRDGEYNYIALSPDISLKQGFTITFFGDDECSDYMGEVTASNPLSGGRNVMINLGLLDGRIDNWKLWQAGKSISVAGKEYSKESTGFDGVLLEAKDDDIDLYTVCNGKEGIFFLDTPSTYNFVNSNTVNVKNLILVSRYDARKVNFNPTSASNLGALSLTGEQGNLLVKGVRFNLADGNAIRPYTKSTSNLHIDNCEIYLPGTTRFFILVNNAALVGPENFKLVNSDILLSGTSGLSRLIDVTYNNKLDTWKQIEIKNNIFCSKTYSQGFSLIYTPKTDAPESGIQETVFTLVGNTFYNMSPHNANFCYVYAYSFGELAVRDNIFYTDDRSAGARRLIYVFNKNMDFPVHCDHNIASEGLTLNYFNPNGYCPDDSSAPIVSDIFETVDTDNIIFTPNNSYIDYGAQR